MLSSRETQLLEISRSISNLLEVVLYADLITKNNSRVV